MLSSRRSSKPGDQTQDSCIAADFFYHLSHQGSPRILEWVAMPSPGDLPDPGIEHGSPALQADSLPAELPEKPYTHHTFLQFSPLNAFENYCFSS